MELISGAVCGGGEGRNRGLINGIHDMHSTLKPDEHPTRSAISSMFQGYQEERMPRIRAAFDATALLTSMHACDRPFYWLAPELGQRPAFAPGSSSEKRDMAQVRGLASVQFLSYR
ncbi:hypothetical protein OQA88_9436 [Cercophora sp. LCS_1]